MLGHLCNMSRRQFIKYSGIGLGILGGFSLFNSLGQLNIVARRSFIEERNELGKDYADLLYLASLAPSGHNTQPWTVRLLTDQHWIIGTDATRWLSVVDPENRETIISIGAFLENLVVTARGKGYDVEIQIIARNAKEKEIVDVKLHKVDCTDTFDSKNIELRRTIRNYFLMSELTKEDIGFLIGADRDRFLYFPRQSKEGNFLAEGTLSANRLQTYQNSAQEELSKWIRWSNQDSKQYRNGLTPESMEIEGIARWYVKNFYTRQSVLENTFRVATIKKIQEQVSSGSGWLLITSKDSSIPELIEVGRKLQRLWLLARDRKIAIHPMNQMMEEAPLRKELSSTLGITEDPQFLLRVGYINNYPHPVSLRMPLQNIIIRA